MSILTALYFNNTLIEYLVFLGIAAGGIILSKIFYWVFNQIQKRYSRGTFRELLIDMIEEPLVVLLALFIINAGWRVLSFPNYPKIPIYYGNIMYTFMLLTAAWMLARLINAFVNQYVKPLAEKSETDLDDTIVPLLSKVVNFTVFVIAGIMILNHFGQEIGPMLAGLGVGGLAFALAAQNIIGNLFGSVSVIADKPFTIGDRIKIDDIDGFVEEIGLRSTTVKTLEGRKVFIPNGKFTDGIVENITLEWARKISLKLGLTYNMSVKQMQKAKDIVKKILLEQDGIDNDNIFVVFTEFGDFSKNILVIYWITDGDKILDIQDQVNFKIMEQFEKAQLDMAFPTQTLEVKQIK